MFTRKLNEVTGAVPEIVEVAARCRCAELILDGEAIALRADGRPQPFQVTMRRFGRKLDVEAMRKALPLRCFFFDALALGGETLIDRPGRERVAALDAALPASCASRGSSRRRVDAAEEFVKGALAQGHEGAMAKALDAPYEAGRRGAGWLKVKQAHTLDLVILAAEWGHGRRQGLALEPPPRRRRPGRGRLRDAGQDLQGPDRSDARLADREAAGAGDRARRLYGPRAAGAGGRDRLQRPPGEPALSWRPGAALRPGQGATAPTSAPRRPTPSRPSAPCSPARPNPVEPKPGTPTAAPPRPRSRVNPRSRP